MSHSQQMEWLLLTHLTSLGNVGFTWVVVEVEYSANKEGTLVAQPIWVSSSVPTMQPGEGAG